MKNLKKNTKGITLVTLVITIVVLLILASIATYSGIEVIKSSRLTTFTTEMKIMQIQVNELYQRYKDGDSIVLDFGKDLNIVSEQANKVLNASGITEQSGYRYFDQNTIKDVLKIEGVEGEFFVNIKTRSVVSYEGFKYDDRIYYTLEQLPNGLYNVEYTDTNEGIDPPTFDTNVEEISEGKWRVTISNIQYEGYIDKWQVNYKLNESDNWNKSEDLSFIVNQEGNYIIKIVNGNVKSEEKRLVAYDDSLPTEYQHVEYIESTGTQYIDTGISMSSINKVETKIQFTSFASNHQGICGRYTSDYSSFQIVYNYQAGYIAARWLDQGVDIPKDYEIHKIKLSNDEISIDENIMQVDKNLASDMDSLYIFARRRDENGSGIQQYSYIRMYEFDIYINSELTQKLIPCYRKSDNEIGMYDTVNNKFYTNQGTGTFKKGNDEND